MNVLDRVRPRVVKAAKRPMDGARSPAAASVLALPVRHESSFVRTEVTAFRAKRVQRNPEALLAPCDGRDTPLGPPIAARGRVLTDPAERDRAARVIRGSWNAWQRVFEVASRPVTPVYRIESVPAP